jgi:Uma2 family endonuclease
VRGRHPASALISSQARGRGARALRSEGDSARAAPVHPGGSRRVPFALGERASFVDGELLREAEASFEHGDAQSSLAAAIKHRFGGGGGWWLATEVDVPYTDERILRHDVVGWRKERIPTRPVGKRVAARPDWVCEILGTNRNHDLVFKRRVLHDAAVPVYWTVELDAPLLTVMRHHADGYVIGATVTAPERARLEPSRPSSSK